VFGEHTGTILMFGGIALACYMLMRRSAGRLARSKRDEPSPREIRKQFGQRDKQQPLVDAPPDLLRWQVEMHETARDLKAEIDTKLAALQALAIVARREAERLETAIGRAAAISAERPDTLEQIARLAERAAPSGQPRLEQVVARLPNAACPSLPPAEVIDQLTERGLSAAEIADRLSVSLGDVELAQSLRPS
jgi:DNA-binding NarL/FixJ family response regulator